MLQLFRTKDVCTVTDGIEQKEQQPIVHPRGKEEVGNPGKLQMGFEVLPGESSTKSGWRNRDTKGWPPAPGSSSRPGHWFEDETQS